jgi:hypothetical protein
MARGPKLSFPMPKAISREVPKLSGSSMMGKYVFGHNPRQQRYSSMEGTHTVVRAPKPGGLQSHTAPLKTEMEHFDSKHGFPGSFGRTGMTGES